MPAWLRAAIKRLSSRGYSGSRADDVGRAAVVDRPGTATVVCWPIIDWEVRFQRPQQVLTRLAGRGHRVIYLRKDVAGWGVPRRAALAPGVTGLALADRDAEDIYSSTPSRGLVDAWVKALADEVPGDDPGRAVSLVHWPFWGPIAFAVRKRLGWPVVYDCMDLHVAFPGTPSGIVDLEDRLVRDADLVLCSSRVLFERHRGPAKRCALVPNGADHEHFARPQSRGVLRRIAPPVVGYFGALAEWFDAGLVAHAAAALPDWSFVLIGLNSGADLSVLERMPNVHLLGERPYRDLPGYLQRFDVSIIPFLLSPLTRAANPVKLYEYLAGGVPVVAVDLPELEPFRELVHVAHDPAGFVERLRVAVAENDPGLRERRREAARANAWELRVEAVARLLDGVLEVAGPQK